MSKKMQIVILYVIATILAAIMDLTSWFIDKRLFVATIIVTTTTLVVAFIKLYRLHDRGII